MFITADVVGHPYGPAPGCKGGDECQHTETVTLGLGFKDGPNPLPYGLTYGEQYQRSLQNLLDAEPRVRDGHCFSVKIC